VSLSRLGPRDPEGYYVIKALRGAEEVARRMLGPEVRVEEAGPYVLIRVKSRSKALRLLRALERGKLLA